MLPFHPNRACVPRLLTQHHFSVATGVCVRVKVVICNLLSWCILGLGIAFLFAQFVSVTPVESNEEPIDTFDHHFDHCYTEVPYQYRISLAVVAFFSLPFEKHSPCLKVTTFQQHHQFSFCDSKPFFLRKRLDNGRLWAIDDRTNFRPNDYTSFNTLPYSSSTFASFLLKLSPGVHCLLCIAP